MYVLLAYVACKPDCVLFSIFTLILQALLFHMGGPPLFYSLSFLIWILIISTNMDARYQYDMI